MNDEFIRDEEKPRSKWRVTGWEEVVFQLADDRPEPLLAPLQELGDAIRGAEKLLASWK